MASAKSKQLRERLEQIKFRAAERARYQQAEHALGVHRIQHVAWQFARRIDAWRGGSKHWRETAGADNVIGRSAGWLHIHRGFPLTIRGRTLHRAARDRQSNRTGDVARGTAVARGRRNHSAACA